MKANSSGIQNQDAGEVHFKVYEANSGCPEAKGSASRHSYWTPTAWEAAKSTWVTITGAVPYATKRKLSLPCGPSSNFVVCKGTSRIHALALRVVIKRDDPPKCCGMIVFST